MTDSQHRSGIYDTEARRQEDAEENEPNVGAIVLPIDSEGMVPFTARVAISHFLNNFPVVVD